MELEAILDGVRVLYLNIGYKSKKKLDDSRGGDGMSYETIYQFCWFTIINLLKPSGNFTYQQV
jgi:hypothetical protein